VLGVPYTTTMRDLEVPLPAYQGRGRRPKAPWQAVRTWRQALHPEGWTRLTVRDGEKGPVAIELVTRRVQTRLERKRTGPEEWLVVTRRPLSDDGIWEGKSSPDATEQDGHYGYRYYLTPTHVTEVELKEPPLPELARVIKADTCIEEAFHRRKRQVWVSWRMDETYIKVRGQWRYLYRAVDKHGQTIDFLLTEHRDKEAALRFLKKAIRRNGLPETITIDGSDANEAAIKSYNEEHDTHIIIRQVKYLNNVVEQDHRAVKRVTRPMLGFKSFDAAQDTLVGIELMHMIKKRQMVMEAGDEGLTAAELFYSLAA
jgi:transposase-like protein